LIEDVAEENPPKHRGRRIQLRFPLRLGAATNYRTKLSGEIKMLLAFEILVAFVPTIRAKKTSKYAHHCLTACALRLA